MKTQYQDTGPRIAYSQSLRMNFVWQDETHSVSGCPLEVLHAFLAHYAGIALYDKPFKLSEAMQCLDGGYGELGRWQAIDTLLLYKVVVPLEYDA
jgi:hypothetical protein